MILFEQRGFLWGGVPIFVFGGYEVMGMGMLVGEDGKGGRRLDIY